MLTFHCANRRKGKGSKITARAAAYKKCRCKWYSKPCRYSYVVEEGGMVDAEQTVRQVNQAL